MSKFVVDTSIQEEVIQEAVIRAKARKAREQQVYDAALGATYEEFQQRVNQIRNDLGQYGEYVHGYTPARHHQFWIDVLDDLFAGRLRGNKLLILCPPNMAKSTWMSIIFPTYFLGKNPNKMVLFFTSSDTNAALFNTSVKMTLEDNERHRYIFPESEARPHQKRGWSGNGLFLRGRPLSEKDPSYRALGWGAKAVGARADVLILDDILDQVSSQSETEQTEGKRYYTQTVQPRLNPDGFIIAVMTRWAEGDMGGYFKDKAEEEGDWTVVELPQEAAENDPLGREPGEPLWPERFSKEWIEREKRGFTIADWNMVHNLDPTGAGGNVFETEKWFRPLPPDLDRAALLYIQGWDLAFSESDMACYTVCVTIGIDAQFNLYILSVFRGKLSQGRVEDKMVELIQLQHPIITGVEESAYKYRITQEIVNNVMARVFANVQIVKPTQDKVARARLPASRAELGYVFIDDKAPWYRTFVSECLGFPNTKNKDQVDAFSLATHMVMVLASQGEEAPIPASHNPHPGV